LRRHGPGIVGVAGEAGESFSVRIGDAVIGVTGVFVSGNYFDVFGTQPAAGRLLMRADDRPNSTAVVVGYRFWQVHLGGRGDAIGREVDVNGRPMRVVGVAPRRFTGVDIAEIGAERSTTKQIWVPLSLAREMTPPPSPGTSTSETLSLAVVARLAADKTPADATREFASANRSVMVADPVRHKDFAVRLADFGRSSRDTPATIAAMVTLLLAAPLSVLALGCANVANLRLARLTARSHELAIRLALGAGRAAIVRLLTIEAALVALLAVTVGWAGAAAVLAVVSTILPWPVALDLRVALFAAALGASVTLMSGVVPAWMVIRRTTALGLKQTPQSGGVAHARLRHALVVAQIAVSLALVTMGGLFGRSLQVLQGAQPAVLDHLLIADLDLSTPGFDAPAAARYCDDLIARLAADGRVSGVGLADAGLFRSPEIFYRVPVDAGPSRRRAAYVARVTPGWLQAMDLAPMAGRPFTAADGPDVAIVSETLANATAPGRSPLGTVLAISTMAELASGGSRPVRVVGVVADRPARVDWISGGAALYLPLVADAAFPLTVTLAVRTDRPSELVGDVARTLAAIDRRAPWAQVAPASERVAQALGPTRYATTGLNALGAIALALAAAGLFAVLAYVVALRSREIGIRMALGASPGAAISLVLRHAIQLLAVGVVAGLAIAMPLALVLQGALVGISPFDPLAIGPALAVLLITTLVAATIPARRAAHVDPVRVLRQE
jgi:predicted permease